MYKGSNPTALKSGEQITDALFRLMAEHPYSEITVKEICYESKLSRQTVYNLFTSKDDIIHAYLHDCVQSVFDHTLSRPDLSLDIMLSTCMSVLKQNEDRMQLIIESGLEEFIRNEIFTGISSFADILLDEEPSDTYDYKISFLGGSFSAVLLTWFKKRSSNITELKSFLEMAFPSDIYKYFESK